MARVVALGTDRDSGYHLFDDLEPQTIQSLSRQISPRPRDKDKFLIIDLRKFTVENPLYDMVKDMKPWLAFFTIWSAYLQKNGWKFSVDLEGYTIAGQLNRERAFLETIEEQIGVLESLSKDRILEFLRRVDQWPRLARQYAASYAAGDLAQLRSKGLRFPSRHPSVIDRRDRIFYERLQGFLQQGDAAIFVGAPHVIGLNKLLQADGYRIAGPCIPE
jgi:uncharacterized protein YbaP (TraB family)